MELEPAIHKAIEELSGRGNLLVDNGEYLAAIEFFEKALSLLPGNQSDWDAATWLHTAIGEAYFFSEDYGAAQKSLEKAMHCPGAIGHPFIHLRLGQVQFELGFDIIAGDELARAYMAGGREIFEQEEPKYWEFIKRRLGIEDDACKESVFEAPLDERATFQGLMNTLRKWLRLKKPEK